MSTELNFNPNRLKLARARRLLTMKGLAESVGMTSRMISNYENGRNDIPTDTLKNVAKTLGYPEEFFKGDDLEELDPNWVSFRSMKGMKAVERDAALSSGSIAILFSEWLESRFQLPPTHLEDLREIETPEEAARYLRGEWGLGEKTISNMIHLLESKGVRVFSLAENNKAIDAFSFWKDDKAFVFLNTFKSAERSRFDAAHELAHLVLHKHGGPGGREAEYEADKFASAFLMPSRSVHANAPYFPNIAHLIKLKKVWLVSLAALVRRLRDLEQFSEWHYRSLYIEMAKRGMLKTEPEPINRETSQVLAKVFRTLKDAGLTKADIARDLHIPPKEIDSLVFGLAFIGTTVSGFRGLSAKTFSRPNLKLIE